MEPCTVIVPCLRPAHLNAPLAPSKGLRAQHHTRLLQRCLRQKLALGADEHTCHGSRLDLLGGQAAAAVLKVCVFILLSRLPLRPPMGGKTLAP